MKIIVVANQKGGVGKTTSAVNIAACLAELNTNVLLIDIDPQGNATTGVGVDKTAIQHSIYDVIINDVPIQDAITATNYKNLHICPSTPDLSGAEVELIVSDQREYRLKAAIKSIQSKFDYVIIDTPPSLGLLTLNALAAADTVLIPIQCEFYALEGVSQLTKTIRGVRRGINPSLDIEGILLTMFDSRTNLSVQVVEEVKRVFPKKVYKTVIPRNVRLSEAPSFGTPIIAFDENSKGATCYRHLAKEIFSKQQAAV